jgi:hypothetical protein
MEARTKHIRETNSGRTWAALVLTTLSFLGRRWFRIITVSFLRRRIITLFGSHIALSCPVLVSLYQGVITSDNIPAGKTSPTL